MKCFAIVGAGLIGTATLIQLLFSLEKENLNLEKIKIVVFEKSQELGPGYPYQESHTEITHLLNTSANNSSIFYDNPLDFFNWLKKHYVELRKDLKDKDISLYNYYGDEPKESEFYPRVWLGKYLNDKFTCSA